MREYRAGIDVGSTTVKLVVLDKNGELLFGSYRRHCAHTQQTLAELLQEAKEQLGDCTLRVGITGSGSINLGKALDIGFVQEVVAVASALQFVAPQTDVAIELGGEDAKIIYFKGGLEERMTFGIGIQLQIPCRLPRQTLRQGRGREGRFVGVQLDVLSLLRLFPRNIGDQRVIFGTEKTAHF